MIKPGMQWPPLDLGKVIERTEESQIWWEGDPDKLDEYYQVNAGANGGAFQRVREFFWGRPSTTTQSNRKLHAPIPADIAKLSASELFSDPVMFLATKPTAKPKADVAAAVDKAAASDPLQDRIDLIFNTPTFHGSLFTSAEGCSALGGSFLRVVWDDTSGVENAWIDFVDADCAIPEYTWAGTLRAVTFWTELESGKDVWRHFQRYEPGIIRHSLYKGTSTNVGREYPLEEHPGTADITIDGSDDDGSFVTTGVDELAAAYVPNVLPNPEWRREPHLKHLGRADIRADLFPIFHALDRIYSSVDREFLVSQARMYASETVLTSKGRGAGMTLSDDAIFTRVGSAMGKDGSMESLFEFHQPAIRILEHDQGAVMLLRRVLSTTGYSPVSFGMSDEVAQTATEARGKKELTLKTTLGKSRYWGAALGPLVTTCLRIDAAKFPGKGVVPVEEVELEWPEFARESDEAKSRTVQGWAAAQAASTRTKVAYLHPDWDDDKVQTEADLIDKAAELTVPDFGGGFGGDQPPLPTDQKPVDDAQPAQDPTKEPA